MKLTLTLKEWSTVELHGSPVDCAIFLNALKGKTLDDSTMNAISEAESNVVVTHGQASSATKPPATPTNRRQRVLMVMRDLQGPGGSPIALGQIVDRYQQTYPEEDVRHLDQVVRDLANKTGMVESPKRGCYRLTDPSGDSMAGE